TLAEGRDYIDTAADAGQPYAYRVQAVDSDGNLGLVSVSSTIILPVRSSSGSLSPAPGTPGSLHAVAGKGGVTLVWNAVPGASAYQVERALERSEEHTSEL